MVPTQVQAGAIGCRLHAEAARERRVAVAPADQLQQPLDHRLLQRKLDFGPVVAVAVDVAAGARAAQQRHVVATCQQPDVVHLRHTGDKELDHAGQQVRRLVACKRIQVGAVDLVEVQIVRRRTGGGKAAAAGVGMNRLHQPVEFGGQQQPGTVLGVGIGRVGADVDDADAIMGVEHGDGVVRAAGQPARQRPGGLEDQGVQHQRRQREVVDPIDMAGDLDLLLVVGVQLDQHLQAQGVGPGRDLGNEVEGFGQHEATRPGALDGIAHGVQAHLADAVGGQRLENAFEVGPPLGMLDIDVELLRRERGPQDLCLAIGQAGRRQRQSGPRAVDRQQLALMGAGGKHHAQRQKQAGIGRGAAVGKVVQKLRRFGRDVVDDHIGHDLQLRGECCDVAPLAQSRIDLGVVDRIEARIGAVDRQVERQQMNATKNAGQQAAGTEQLGQLVQRSTAESVDVGDELDGVVHGGFAGADSAGASELPFSCK